MSTIVTLLAITFGYAMISGILHETVPESKNYNKCMVELFWILIPLYFLIFGAMYTPIWIGNKIGKCINKLFNHLKQRYQNGKSKTR